MQQRYILHIDINHCYAQIEEMMNPQYKEVPMAVGGHEESRHGIILTKNLIAKKYGVKTAETLREAKRKCPNLVIIHPDYPKYQYYTTKVKDIYRRYSDKVESFGLDEAWVDITHSTQLFGSPIELAKRIQREVRIELGLTVSIGLSGNKIFAKMGSDMFKPYGLVYINDDNYKDIIWPLPISDLFYVGRQTTKKMLAMHIETIGQLALLDKSFLKLHFGKMGELLWIFANGEDVSEVMLSSYQDEVKSVGNSITTTRDLNNSREVRSVFYVLSESIASRLKDDNLVGNTIGICLRTNELTGFVRQKKIENYTNISGEILDISMKLLNDNYDFSLGLRSVGIRVTGLKEDDNIMQINLFEDPIKRIEAKKLDKAIDYLRSKYGFYSVKRCCMLLDNNITNFNPKGEHTIFPRGYF
ncbi:MAG: DNA polymerase IV [Thomasclavelia sp.]|jgi:DNA polymerase-4|nr:DNA polymerase IV [Thomasclavelia sp.]